MIRFERVVIAIFLLATPPVFAGVEMDLVTTDAEGAVTESVKLYAQSGKIRMEDIGDASGQDMSMIFIGREFIVVDHSDRSYIVMDEAMVVEMGAKMKEAMDQIREEMADMAPEDRAIVEQMLQSGTGGTGGEEDVPSVRVQKVGSGNWQSGNCTRYEIFDGSEKTQEICSAPLDGIDGADEALRAFANMARFINTLSESMPGPLGASMAGNPMGLMEQIDGFPVRTVDYVAGSLVAVTTLESVRDKTLEANLFEIPDGYRQVDPFAGE